LAWVFSRNFGLTWDGGMGLVILAPAALVIGIPAAAAMAVVGVLLAVSSERLLNNAEKRQLVEFAAALMRRGRMWLGRPTPTYL
jgi:hypothetical protein